LSGRKQGDADSFKRNWQERKETHYTHWIRTEPQNQIQLAFRNHWSLLNELMRSSYFNRGKRVLEVGCGRGSLSCYFSDAGYDCTLLDISKSVIDVAQKIFKAHHLKGTFKIGNANALPFDDKSFDVVFSIGLLEHFEDIEPTMREQIRVLDEGGIFFGYIVPRYSDNIQKDYEWINEILKGYAKVFKNCSTKKKRVFRSDAGSERYLSILNRYELKGVRASGVYPLPMISHSKEFPFTLMPKESEKALVRQLKMMLQKNNCGTGEHPWLCEEGYGQAFAVWGYK
jgi:ubiquinone/menaquinone biosynthesis C-methylase UbiE